MTTKTVTVEIPEAYLIILAVHGNMGDGEVPILMQDWAERQCKQLGLGRKMEDEKIKRYEIVRERATKILGPKMIEQIERTAEAIFPPIQAVMRKTAL